MKKNVLLATIFLLIATFMTEAQTARGLANEIGRIGVNSTGETEDGITVKEQMIDLDLWSLIITSSGSELDLFVKNIPWSTLKEVNIHRGGELSTLTLVFNGEVKGRIKSSRTGERKYSSTKLRMWVKSDSEELVKSKFLSIKKLIKN